MEPQENSETPKKKGFNYKAWYQKNKTQVAQRRAKRYAEDEDYRNKVIATSRAHRKKRAPTPHEGWTVAFQDAASALDVSMWTLREWRRKQYFPEPRLRDTRLWFRPEHVDQLGMLERFFADKGRRLSAAQKVELENLVAVIFANWA